MKKRLLIVFTMAALLLMTSCGKKDSITASSDNTSYNENTTEENTEASSPKDQYAALGFDKFDFTANGLDSLEYSNKIFENSKVTLINFWGTFCGPCKAEIPDLQAISEKYDKKDLQVVGVIVDTFEGSDVNIDTAKSILKSDNVNYLNIVPNENLYETYLQNSIQAVPTTIFVDSKGNLIGNVLMGAQDEEHLTQVIDELIASQK